MSLRRGPGSIGLILLLCGVMGLAQSSTGWIQEMEVVDLVPFEVSFRFTNGQSAPLSGVSGTATLMDRFGQPIEQMRIGAFSILPEASETIHVQSRWEFQQTGIYLIDVALDLGDGTIISNSLGFRILPIQLPLAPVTPAEGEGLFTVYQQPVSWGLARVFAPEAWTITHGSPEIVVAVIDSGIDRNVEQLRGSLWINDGEIPGNGIDDDRNGYVDDMNGWDFRDDDNDALVGSPLHSHGTIVASIIAAQPGDLPIVGIAPGVRLMDVRFLDSSNSFRSSDWGVFVDAIDYAVDNGADIINLSIYANGRPPRDFEQALQAATRRGVIIVGIAGNRGRAEVMYPGKLDTVVAISATTENDLLASFSNTGSEVALCAPGSSITSLAQGGGAITQSGTSFAAPHVTGILALLLSAAPNLSAERAVEILAQTAVDLGPRGKDDMYGSGLVNALEALRAILR